jgi:NTP pyrophosphatase (non-canonical NTP hydrolase)
MKYPKKLKTASSLTKRTLIARVLKLCEEAGELSAEVLKFSNLKGRGGKSKSEVEEDLREEAVDCLIMSLDILIETGTSEKHLNELLNKKLDKWMGQLKK